MFHFSEDERVYNIHSGKQTIFAEKYGKIAFALNGDIETLTPENTEQLDKIIASAKQTRDNSLLLNILYTDISFHYLSKMGVSTLVVFSNHLPEIFHSLTVLAETPFEVSGIVVFIAPELENLQKNAPAKLSLWNFMKKQIA